MKKKFTTGMIIGSLIGASSAMFVSMDKNRMKVLSFSTECAYFKVTG